MLTFEKAVILLFNELGLVVLQPIGKKATTQIQGFRIIPLPIYLKSLEILANALPLLHQLLLLGKF
jgi:hypothetical protein